jgi:hypothetical protein
MFKSALILVLAQLAVASFYNYSACGAMSYLNAANLKCISCPTNQIANTY